MPAVADGDRNDAGDFNWTQPKLVSVRDLLWSVTSL